MSSEPEPSLRFAGRSQALRAVQAWLRRANSPVLVVNGSPGAGKSALLTHLVALGDADRPVRRRRRHRAA